MLVFRKDRHVFTVVLLAVDKRNWFHWSANRKNRRDVRIDELVTRKKLNAIARLFIIAEQSENENNIVERISKALDRKETVV